LWYEPHASTINILLFMDRETAARSIAQAFGPMVELQPNRESLTAWAARLFA
jgi:hypothetical protein